MTNNWKRQAIDNMESSCLSNTGHNSKTNESETKEPQAQIGQPVIEGAFFSESLLSLRGNRRKALAPNRSNNISAARQAYLLAIRQSSYFYKEMNETSLNFELIRLIDQQFLKTPYYGSRRMALHLYRMGYAVSSKRIGRLMRLMGLSPIIYQKLNPAKPHPVSERI